MRDRGSYGGEPVGWRGFSLLLGAWLCLTVPGVLAEDLRPGEISAADTAVGRTLEAPVDTRPLKDKFWWSDDWFDRGLLEVPDNHEIDRREISYLNPADKTEVPALLLRPKTAGGFPAVLFAHGRRGLDELVERMARRIAARGFVVLAPDLYAARMIETMPVRHDPATVGDLEAGVDALLRLPDVATSKLCLASHTRGGYYALKVAVSRGRQKQHVACYVSAYPHWQDPNSPEPDQVYRYAGEADRLEIPALIVMGEYEQYQRRRPIEMAVKAMKQAGRDVRLIIYPGVGRGFDFRSGEVRTFADDLAAKDAAQRAAVFMTRHLTPWLKK
jgi:carboxymethylenebutenolidase